MKKFWSLLLVLALILSMSTAVFTEETNKDAFFVVFKINEKGALVGNNIEDIMSYNFSFKTLNAPPIIVDGRTLVPLRIVSENFGFTVDYFSEDRSIAIRSITKETKIQIDSTEAFSYTPDGKLIAQKTIVPPIISNGTTMVPLRFVSEELGLKLLWESTNQIVGVYNEDTEKAYTTKMGKEKIMFGSTYSGMEAGSKLAQIMLDKIYPEGVPSNIKIVTPTPVPLYTSAPDGSLTYNLNPDNCPNLPFGVVFDGGEHVFKDTSDKTITFNSKPQKDPNNPSRTSIKSEATITTPALRDDVQIWTMPDSGIEGVTFGADDPVNGIININANFDFDFIKNKPSGEYKGVFVCNCISKKWKVVERVTFNLTIIKE